MELEQQIKDLTDQLEARDESITKLENNNKSLKEELIVSRGKTADIFNAFEIDPSDENPVDKIKNIKTKLSDADAERQNTLTENEKLHLEMGSMKTQLNDFIARDKKLKDDNDNLKLSNNLTKLLTDKGVGVEYHDLLMSGIKKDLTKDEDGNFFHKNGDIKLSVEDFAGKFVEKYPQLVARNVGSGSGSGGPSGTNQTKTYDELIAMGRYSEARALNQ